ncbi:MAG: glycoside hydrolase family 2 TIM barrel-domain containing protein, partial [Planctomycetota bacterium]|nr:glycoside hydrolase family 2 TIM barrel-domain containing protein [Planctomycetota bacterium]
MAKRCLSVIFTGLFLLPLTGCQFGFGQTVRDFDFDWKFTKGDVHYAQAKTFDDAKWRTVQLPHDWSIEGPYSQEYASGTGYLPGGIGWYRKTFTLPLSLQGRQIAIEFDGIYNNSEVWINGFFLGKRPYGYISFQYDLTDYLNFGGENVLAVRVDHSQFADSRWYTGSGIYRHARLHIKNPLHIEHWGTCITTPIANDGTAQIQVETTVRNSSDNPKVYKLRLRVLDKDGKVIETSESKESIAAEATAVVTQTLAVVNPQLWSPDSPNLYTLESCVAEGLKTADKTTTAFGIRQFRFDSDDGFFLNGENMTIKGVCLHHDGGPVGAAVPKKMWVQRLKKLKRIGCNAIRCSHNPPAPEFLDLCDEMGFLVINEAFDEFTPTKNKWVEGRNKGVPSRAGYGTVFEEWAVRDIQDMVRRDRNHPSIILWSIGNEVDYPNDPFSHPSMGDNYRPDNPPAENLTKYGKDLVAAIKQLDTTRPVTAALANAPVSNIVGFADLFDVVGYNYQERLYEEDHAKYPERPLLGSENSTSLNAWKAVEQNDYISGQFLWIGIDYLGESPGWPFRSWTGGLFDLCGFKKPRGWFRQSLWADEPMVYIACFTPRLDEEPRRRRRRNPVSHWNWRPGEDIRTICYTNCDEMELFLNGTSLGSQPLTGDDDRILSWKVPFEKGTLKAVGKRNGKAVCDYSLQTTGKAETIRLSPDTKTLAADGKDICYLEFFVTDENDIRIPDAD